MTLRTLVMGDVHGAYEPMLQALNRAGFNPESDRLIQLGDVVDRGPDSYACMEYLLTVPNLIPLKGNHDHWFHDFITTGYHTGGWAHGGRATIQSYGARLPKPPVIIPKADGACKTSLEPTDIPISHQQFFASQKLYFIDEQNNCFIHAGFDRKLHFLIQPTKNYYWDRTLWNGAMAFVTENEEQADYLKGTYQTDPAFNNIFIGHTPTTNWHTDQPMNRVNIWNLDTGASHQGRLTVMDVETKEYWQSDKVV